MRRRDLLILGGLVAGAYTLGWWLQRPRFDFYEMDAPAGFRRLGLGAVSGTADVFIGLDHADPEVVRRAVELEDPCPALFGTGPGTGVRIAMFTDIQCPYCRVLEPEVMALTKRRGIELTFHDPALLGPTSEAGARAILAAERQGKGDEMRRRLASGRFAPTPGFISTSATDLAIDGTRMLADLNHASIDDRLLTAKALALVFGIPGTPALIVGRTLVVGTMSPRQLEALLDLELTEGISACT